MGNVEINQNKKRMVLLLRNSSKKQAEKKINEDGKVEYDIPLQRSILTPWAERLGYTIVKELVEGGVSGFKVSSAKRDAVIEIKEMANRGEFDVLGIYMSDRLGRIADETPLIVSYLNNCGIKVLSYTDDEISSKTHDEKLMTYIRYWRAEGESLKTSKKIKDAHGMAVEQGKWRGGNPPYGYKTVSKGTLNGKGGPIFDVEIDPPAAEVVKTIFRLYKEHYAFKRIATYLNDNNIPQALVIATSAMYAYEKIGLPEGMIPLTNAIIYVCEAEKSNSVVRALDAAKYDAVNTVDDNVPLALRDGHYKGSETRNAGAEYLYPHEFGGWVEQQYLPDKLKDKRYYVPGENGFEGGRRVRKEKKKY